MIKVSDLFDVFYGVNLELNAMVKSGAGINFVSRTSKNNGVSAKVKKHPSVVPIPAGTISVASGGSVMESFLQPEPYYSGRDLYYLVPKSDMSDAKKLFYCACLRANKYRYNYGRQANRSLRDILLPDLNELPAWVDSVDINRFEGGNAPLRFGHMNLNKDLWQPFELQELFDIKKGKRLTKANMKNGGIPFIGATDSRNGITAMVSKAIHAGNTISVSYNGSVAEAFYQPSPFWATDDVNVLYPRFKMTPAIALFIAAIIRREKYRFNYGRKWHLERMRISVVRLPVDTEGTPDGFFMENYISSLPYSSQIA